MNWRKTRDETPKDDAVKFVLGHGNTPMTAVYRSGFWFRRKFGSYSTRVDGIIYWADVEPPKETP